MSLNPTGHGGHNWNYSKPDQPDYSLEFFGTIVSVQEVQARDWSPAGGVGRPSTWPDGNPKMNIRIGFADPQGQLKSITFQKAGKKQVADNVGLHMQFYNISGGNMSNLVGKTVHLWTWPVHPDDGTPLAGQQWQRGNPRLFGLEEWAEGQWELANPLPEEFKVPSLLADDGAHGGQVQAQPQQPPMNSQYYAAPRPAAYFQPPVYQQPMPQQYPQPMPQQYPQYQQPRPITVPQVAPMQMGAQQPAGMDPQVAAAMQALGAQNIQPVAQPAPQAIPQGNVYDDIPF